MFVSALGGMSPVRRCCRLVSYSIISKPYVHASCMSLHSGRSPCRWTRFSGVMRRRQPSLKLHPVEMLVADAHSLARRLDIGGQYEVRRADNIVQMVTKITDLMVWRLHGSYSRSDASPSPAAATAVGCGNFPRACRRWRRRCRIQAKDFRCDIRFRDLAVSVRRATRSWG